jgi:hypothetical protein
VTGSDVGEGGLDVDGGEYGVESPHRLGEEVVAPRLRQGAARA